jgi:hypothetical protein
MVAETVFSSLDHSKLKEICFYGNQETLSSDQLKAVMTLEAVESIILIKVRLSGFSAESSSLIIKSKSLKQLILDQSQWEDEKMGAEFIRTIIDSNCSLISWGLEIFLPDLLHKSSNP